MENNLIPKQITPKEIFVLGGLDPIIAGVKSKVKKFNAPSLDMDKKKDRDELRSFSADIARSKTFVEDKRKLFVKDKKEELKIVDQEVKKFRDKMDEIRIDTREPLTKYEDAEKAKAEAERQLEIFNMDHEEALEINIFEDKKADILRQEAELAKKEKDLKAKEEKKQAEKDRIENEERIKKEAAEKATRDAQEKIDRAERDKIEAAETAKIEKENAIEEIKRDAKREQEEKERKIADAKALEERKAQNKNHQRRIDKEALEDLMTIVDEEKGKEIITALVNKQIRHINIKY